MPCDRIATCDLVMMKMGFFFALKKKMSKDQGRIQEFFLRGGADDFEKRNMLNKRCTRGAIPEGGAGESNKFWGL